MVQPQNQPQTTHRLMTSTWKFRSNQVELKRHDVWPILTRFDARFLMNFLANHLKPANFSLVKGLQAKDQLKEAMSFEA